MKKVIGMGNALVDIMTKLPDDDVLNKFSLPKGSMQLVDNSFIKNIENYTRYYEKHMASGGSAANTIHGLANLGISTGYFGKVGLDELGSFFRNDILDKGIHPHLLTEEALTGRAMALVSPDSERTFATFLGAAAMLRSEEISQKLFKDYDYFHIEGYLVQDHNLISNALMTAKKLKLKISIDLASYNVVESHLEFLRDLIHDYIDIVFANEEEAKAFTGKEPEDALKEIAAITDVAIVKIGRNGSLIQAGNEFHRVNAIAANAIDTTGAGDLYAAGFLYGLIKKLPLNKCGDIGALLAGKVIEVMGAKISDEEWEVIRFMLANGD